MFIYGAKRRIISLYSSGKALLNNFLSVFLACLLHKWPLQCMAIPYVIAHGKLHKTCLFNITRKCGPRKHATGMNCSFLMTPPMEHIVKMKLSFSSTLAYGTAQM